jgi:hypothetical protein
MYCQNCKDELPENERFAYGGYVCEACWVNRQPVLERKTLIDRRSNIEFGWLQMKAGEKYQKA